MTKFTDADLRQLQQKGISVDTVEKQLESFRKGFPYLKIESAAGIGTGITPVDDDLMKIAEERWNGFLADGGRVVKFVPASGAASRMFKALFAFVNSEESIPAEGSPVAELVANIEKFAFFADLENTVGRLYGKTIAELVAEGRAKDLVKALILPEGLNYGALPKALLKFHRYGDESVTALEEQLAEGAEMAASKDGAVNVHFTVSADHHKLFDAKLEQAIPEIEKKKGVKFHVSLSEQKPSTDTIAVTPDNELFRDDSGRLVFRPGGHGALIENLNDIDSTVVFIKNIDNIAQKGLRDKSVQYKKVLGGMLMLVHDRMTALAARLRSNPDEATVEEARKFVNGILCTTTVDLENAACAKCAAEEILRIFDRPLRVCGMVRNEGEPGGGPYNAWSSDGKTLAPQILESSQIDLSKDENKELMAKATHFNPVDLACYLKREDGSAYDLPRYVDHATGFISSKSLGGRELRALELPGLWNGAMSDWNTVFIEVPAFTFTPAKTVNDLLRAPHQA